MLISNANAAEAPSPEAVKAMTRKVAGWQVDTFEESGKYRALSKNKKERAQKWRNRKNYHNLESHMAAFYAATAGCSEDWH